MDFAAAWTTLSVGEDVIVTDGRPEPEMAGSLDWKVWASHNFTGELMEKMDGPPRKLRFRRVVGDSAILSYETGEDMSYSFQGLNPGLTELKASRTQEVETLWRSVLNDSCSCTAGVIDSSEESRLFVSGAVTMATLAISNSQTFSIRWRLKDNGYANLDGPGMVQMGVELGTFVNLCCQARFDAKDAIESSTTTEELEAIDISSYFNSL